MARGRRLEARFSAQLRKELSIVYPDMWIHLIPDMMRTGKKPFDFYFLNNGLMTAIECKYIDGKSFSINNLQPHQPDCLRKVIQAGGKGYFVIYFARENKVLVLNPDQLDYIFEIVGKNYFDFNEAVKYRHHMFMHRMKINGMTRWEVEKLVNA